MAKLAWKEKGVHGYNDQLSNTVETGQAIMHLSKKELIFTVRLFWNN